MDGLLFLSSLIAIGLLMFWVILNDRAKPDSRTTGLFAIRWHKPDAQPGQSPAERAAGGRRRGLPFRR